MRKKLKIINISTGRFGATKIEFEKDSDKLIVKLYRNGKVVYEGEEKYHVEYENE